MTTFKYLRSTLAEDIEPDEEVTPRVLCEWKNRNTVSGVLCDKEMNVKIKGNVYRTLERPAVVYGAETICIEEGTGKISWTSQKCEWYDGCAELQNLTG